MEEIKKYREEIDLIDEQIQTLFLRRMKIVESIANYKMNHDLSVYDHNRETEVIQRNLGKIPDSEYLEYYEEFLLSVMKISKDFQKKIIIRSTLWDTLT